MCGRRGRHYATGVTLVLLPDQPDPGIGEVGSDDRGDCVRVAVVDDDQFPV